MGTQALRILFVAPRYDSGKPERGPSFEHCNFYEALAGMGHEVSYFDFPSLAAELGEGAMNRRLEETVKAERPAVMFTVLGKGLLEQETLRRISAAGETTTVNWFCDDHWRFDGFTREWAGCFNWAVTTAHAALPKYRAAKIKNVILSQWACNELTYRKLDLPMKHDVTFVGLPHGRRREMVAKLRAAGVNVRTWGAGWPEGRLTQREMIEAFNQSRINLNFAESSATGEEPGWAGAAARAYVRRPLQRVPGGWRVVAGFDRVARAVVAPPPRQIKGRVFEVPGCGGFLLTNGADHLEDYFTPGNEIALFESDRELVDRVRYYLAHEKERAEIAAAGHRRAVACHTYAQRFEDIFARMGLAAPAAQAA